MSLMPYAMRAMSMGPSWAPAAYNFSKFARKAAASAMSYAVDHPDDIATGVKRLWDYTHQPAAKRAATAAFRDEYPRYSLPAPGFQRNSGYYGRFTGPQRELKFFDTALSFVVDDTAEVPASGQLCLIPQDQTQSGRDGNKVTIKSINIHGTANMVPGSATNASAVMFLYVIQDTQCNGAAATVGDANTGIFTSANLAVANHTIANSGRFKVLKKFVMPFNSAAGVAAAFNTSLRVFSWHGKCNIPIVYDAVASTGALTTIRSNNIFLVAGAASTGQDDTIAVQGTVRLRYSDWA